MKAKVHIVTHAGVCRERCRQSISFIGLFVLLVPMLLHAQRYRFKYFSHTDGLKDTEVHALLQDQTGFIWVGTSTGLFRYDGMHFSSFVESDGAKNFIEALAETTDGTLWVGTHYGLARMHGDHLEFVDPPGWTRITGQSSITSDARGRSA